MLKNIISYGIIIGFSWILIGCGGSSSTYSSNDSGIIDPNDPNDIPRLPLVEKVASAQQASTVLSRATFGATTEEIEDMITNGNYSQWFETQFSKTPNYLIEWVEKNAIGVNGEPDLKDSSPDADKWKNNSTELNTMQQDGWWDITVNGDDQLRQRVAFALSEIMVISIEGSAIKSDGRMAFYDILVKNALGNFETLLQEVTYSSAMGEYLSYRDNRKADPEIGNHPDENYAREVMQLFTIGLYQLNLDGSKKLDSNGVPLPTYNQKDIEEMARVFTGLTSNNGNFGAGVGVATHISRSGPMVAYEQYHDTGEKAILGQTISGGDTRTDINQALNLLFKHPNTGPFIAKRLIQRLVTSNPSPHYIGRVALAFNDNGKGVRGDMKAVVKAILLDQEAFMENSNAQTFGKVREPLLFFSHLFKAFHAQNTERELNGVYTYSAYHFYGTEHLEQTGPMRSLTVFNYFTPYDGPYSLLKEGLVAPEFKVFNDALHKTLMGIINKDTFIYETYKITAELQIDYEKALLKAGKYDELLDHLDTLLVAGKLSDKTKSAIKSYIVQKEPLLAEENGSDTLARYVISLVITSPDYAVQR